MAGELFRREAVEFQQQQSNGDVLLAHPPSFSVITCLAVVIALSVLVFAFWGEYTRKSHVQGYLIPTIGLIKVYPSQTGILSEEYVEEGQKVSKGDPLFLLTNEHRSLQVVETQAAAMEQLKQRKLSLEEELSNQVSIDHIDERNLRVRLRGLRRELDQIGREINIQTKRTQSAGRIAVRYQNLLKKKFVAEIEVDEKHDSLLDQQAKLVNLKRNRTSLEREISTSKLDLSSSGFESKKKCAAITREISKLEQDLTEYESRRSTIITAPSNGVVTTILGRKGQNATTDQPLLSILPVGALLEANLLVPSRAVGFIEKGQTVAIQYQAFPYQRFGSHFGKITEISKTLIIPNETKLPISLEEPAYRLTIALESQTVTAYQKEIHLKAGMRLEADIWLDRRPIIQWIMDPLFSITKRI